MRVDVHAHHYPQEYVSLRAGFGGDVGAAHQAPGAGVTLDQRLELMDRIGIRVQVLSIGAQHPYFADRSQAIQAAKLANDAYADIRHRYGGRYEAFAAVPLPHVDAALAEAERALDTLGMVGVNLGCSIAGQALDDRAFDPFFAELNRRKTVVFLHPIGMGCGPLVEQLGLNFPAGAPFEDTVAALRLAMTGLTVRHPDVRFIVPHLGGTLPFLVQRFDDSLASRGQDKPAEQFKRMWFDTCNNHIPSLRCSRDTFGASQLVLGTDFPHVAGERFDRCVSYIEDSDLPPDEKTAILDRNAQALLGLRDR
ncbi:MAG TPA: amidohydrolase family protein [Chloroflexota bacterium]|nr:amidohydrolase family protein [Chloroflexota bacterium]